MPEAQKAGALRALVERECQTEIGGPCSLVTMLEVSVNGRKLFIPRSLLAGLRNVRLAQLTAHPGAFHLTLRGGDGAEGFVTTILFDKERVLKRFLASTLMPAEVLEEITYRTQSESFDR
ncbi:MAG TPA: hypothetical protein VGM81_19605 [Burkholderiaceae bacterium]|jgi:hypothetical protein